MCHVTEDKSVHSMSDVSMGDMNDMNDGEWMSYTDSLDSFMLQAYEDASNEFTPRATVDNMLTDEMEADETDKVVEMAKKTFRKRLTNNLIILYGLQRETVQSRLD